MKEEAIFIAVTGSQDMYSKDWLIYNTDYPENKNLKSGDLAKVYLRDADIEFTDYYWTESDYRHIFAQAEFNLLEIHILSEKRMKMFLGEMSELHLL